MTLKHYHSTSFHEIRLGIVCPMANEEKTAERFVSDVLNICRPFQFKKIYFLAILDNACTDATMDILTELSKQMPELHVIFAKENRNVVDAYLRGYQEALKRNADWILEIDGGFSHNPAEIPEFFKHMSTNAYDCVFGSRFMPASKYKRSSTKRFLLSYFGTALTNLLLGTKLKDMTSGFELFTAPSLNMILNKGIQSKGPFFQTEIKAYAHQLRICEIPISYKNPNFNIKTNTIINSLHNLWRLFLLRLNGKL